MDEMRPVRYCVVPGDLASRLHEPLRRHFADDPLTEVVVERRRADRRNSRDRRAKASEPHGERRLIRNPSGRRVADQRQPSMPVEPPELPRRARRHAERLTFLERIEPTSQHLEDVDTARLVLRIQGGDCDRFGDLYLRYFDRVYGYLSMVLSDRHEAEDATQQVFLRVLENLSRYETGAKPFRAWLFTIARNNGLTQLRKRAGLEVEDPGDIQRRRDTEDQAPEEAEQLQALHWISDRELLLFVERLPLSQRQVLVLRYMLDLNANQIAEILGCTPNKVRMLQHRSHKYLRQRLVALGRDPGKSKRSPWRVRTRQAIVLRERRFILQP